MTMYEKRMLEIERQEANTENPGHKGNAFELKCARPKSRKIKVAEQNEPDVFVKFKMPNGTYKYIPCECKTNGGRVDSLLSDSEAKYVIYDLHFIQEHKPCKKHNGYNEYRDLKQPVIIRKDLFLAKLKEFNAIKAINRKGKFDGYGIQPSNKKWFLWLCEYPITFNNEAVYESWEFEGLE